MLKKIKKYLFFEKDFCMEEIIISLMTIIFPLTVASTANSIVLKWTLGILTFILIKAIDIAKRIEHSNRDIKK